MKKTRNTRRPRKTKILVFFVVLVFFVILEAQFNR